MKWLIVGVGVVVIAIVFGLFGRALVRTVFGDNDLNDSDRDGDTSE